MNRRAPKVTSSPPPLERYEPARARRIATLTRRLWAEMRALVDRLVRITHANFPYDVVHDPWAGSPYMEEDNRMRLRTLQIVLRGYSAEHRVWAARREHGYDRDEESGLFQFMNEIHFVVEDRLESLEKEVLAFDRNEYGHRRRTRREEYFGSGYCEALGTLRAAWTDWSKMNGILDSIDYEGDEETLNLDAENAAVIVIERRAAERRQGVGRKPAAPAKPGSRRKRPVSAR